MSHPSLHPFRSAGCALLALAASCAGPNLYRENREALAAANKLLLAGQLDPARAALESCLVRTRATPDAFVLQRYFAAYLLSRAALESSLHAGKGWLEAQAGTTYYMNFALDWHAAAAAAAPAVDGEPLLPPDLAGFGIERAQTYRDLAGLIVCGRLRFLGEIAMIVGQQPGLAAVAAAERLADDVGLDAALRPWLMWSLFEFHKARDEKLAYTFGIRARELGRQEPATFPAEQSQQIVDWILNGSKFVFRSSAGVEFDPGAEVCSQTGEPNIRFQGSPK